MDEHRIPVLVGVGQVTQRESDPRAALQPLDLMAAAAKQAADDSGAGARLLQALDNVTVIRLFADTSPRFACPFGGSSNPPASEVMAPPSNRAVTARLPSPWKSKSRALHSVVIGRPSCNCKSCL